MGVDYQMADMPEDIETIKAIIFDLTRTRNEFLSSDTWPCIQGGMRDIGKFA